MRIGHIAPINFNIPDGRSGPVRVFIDLNEALYEKGVNLKVFATKNSKIKGDLHYIFDKELNSLSEFNSSDRIDKGLFFLKHLSYSFSKNDEVDIFISHLTKWTPYIANLVNTKKTIIIVHNITESFLYKLEKFNNNNIHFVCLSEPLGNIFSKYANNYSVINNGIDISSILPNYNKKNYFLYVGRLVKSKAPDLAIKACIKNNVKLILIGKEVVEKDTDRKYFEEEIKPYLNHKLITYLPEVSHNKIFNYYKNAKALIFPLRDYSHEGMPLVLAEALASATPVISLTNPLTKNLLNNKVSILLESEDDLINRITDVDKIIPQECRTYAEERFTRSRMANEYLYLAERLINQ